MRLSSAVQIAAAALVCVAASCGSLPGDQGAGGSGGGFQTSPPDGGQKAGAGGTAGESDLGLSEGTSPTAPNGGAGGEPPPLSPMDGGVDLCPEVDKTLDKTIDAAIGGAQSTGSATAAVEFLKGLSRSPLPSDIRTQDFLNYYVPKPAAVSQLSVLLELKPGEVAPYFDLLVALQAPPLTSPREALDVTVVLDNTESLGSEGLERAQAALGKLVGWIDVGDTLRLVTATPGAAVETYDVATKGNLSVNDITFAPEKSVVELVATGYAEASKSAASQRLIVLIADGEGDPLRLVIPSESSIRLAAIGVGPELRYGHRLLRGASRLGNGPYVYLDSVARADELDFERLFFIAANDVELNLRLPWYFSVERPFSGSAATAAEVERQYLAPEQVSVFMFRLVACHPDAPSTVPAEISATLTWAGGDVSSAYASQSVPVLLASAHPELDKSFAVLTYAEALRSLDARRLEHALAVVTNVQAQQSSDPDLGTIADLLQSHPALAGNQ